MAALQYLKSQRSAQPELASMPDLYQRKLWHQLTLNLDQFVALVVIQGAAVTLSELGEYNRAASFLESLTKEKPDDHGVYRLLGEVKYELGDYEGSAAAYRSSASVSNF